MATTMTEAAGAAGVSQKTVSRVVNGEPHVSPDVRDRVLRATRELDYRPNNAHLIALIEGRPAPAEHPEPAVVLTVRSSTAPAHSHPHTRSRTT
ncbi:LacI family DNA-binding transcriptional regulator [Streptomyces sp. HD]|uniref:LacI family DNA-binding transcriptional regulator n=1 Tax=Streptomyces sp. HD TaxID=3020892 RepID=UPI003FA6E53A